MAYATKYRFTRTDAFGAISVVELQLNNYAGGITDVPKAGISYSFGKQRSNNVVKGSSATIRLWAQTKGEFSEFRDITDRMWKVKVTKGTLYWTGWITPQIFSEPYAQSAPYLIQLTAVDGLGDLQNIDFRDTDGSALSGRESFRSIIQRCLNLAGMDLNFCFSSKLRIDGTTGNPFDTPYFDMLSFRDNDGKPMKAYDVLNYFFPLGITIKQSEGKWWILRQEDLRAASVLVYEYTSDGTLVGSQNIDLRKQINGTGDVNPVNLIVNKSAVLGQEEAYKEATVVQDYGKKPSMLTNWDFFNQGEAWTDGTGGKVSWIETNDKDAAYLRLMDADGSTTGITQSINVKATVNDLAIEIDVCPIAWYKASTASTANKESTPINIRMQVKIVGSTTYYLDKDSGWVTTPAYIDIADMPSAIDAYNPDWQTVKIYTDNIPVDGVMTVELCRVPYQGTGGSSGITILGVDYSDVNIYMLGDAYTSSLKLKEVNNEDYNYIPTDFKSIIGDIPAADNNKLMYQHFVSTSDGTPTTAWTVDGITGTFELSEQFLRHEVSRHRSPLKYLSGVIRGQLTWHGTILDKEGVYYEVVSADLDDRNQEWNVELREIKTYANDGVITTESTRSTSSGASRFRSTSDNMDYRVYSGSVGEPKRITDLAASGDLVDANVFEVDEPGWTESKQANMVQMLNYILTNLGISIDVTNNRLIFSYSLLTEGYVGSQYAGGDTPSWMDMLPIASTILKGIAQFSSDFFEVTNGVVTLKAGVGGAVESVNGKTGVVVIGISDIANLQTTLDAKLNASLRGVANGVASLDGSGLIPTTQLPSFVDDVLEYSSFSAFPVTGTSGKIYVALDTNKTYRWSGSTYIYITSGAVDSVNSKTGVVVLTTSDITEGTRLYFTNARVKSYADTLYVPLTRTVAGKALSSNITLASTDLTDASNIALKNGTLQTNLNADLLDGQHGSYYRNASNVNAGTIGDSYLPSIQTGKIFNSDVSLSYAGALINLGNGGYNGPHGFSFFNSNNTIGINQYYRTTPETLYFEDSIGTKIMSLPSDGSDVLIYSNKVWHAGNSNLNTVDWNMKDAYINGIKLEKATVNVPGVGNVEALKVNSSLASTGYMGSQVSDKRIKTDIKEIEPEEALQKVIQIKSYTYRRKDLNGIREIGHIANEVEEVEPMLVGTMEHAGIKDFKTMSYERSPVLHNAAIKALFDRIEKLEAQNEKLEARIEQLENRKND